MALVPCFRQTMRLNRVPFCAQRWRPHNVTFNQFPLSFRGFHTSSFTMRKEDLYSILGAPPKVTDDELKNAYEQTLWRFERQYQKLVQMKNPPKLPLPNRNKTEKSPEQRKAELENSIRKVKKAYEILKDKEKRQSYDNYGHAAFDGRVNPEMIAEHLKSSVGADPLSSSVEEDLPDFRRGDNIELPVTLPFMKAIEGTQIPVEYEARVKCMSCHGSGATMGSLITPCIPCDKQGYVKVGKGIFQTKYICSCCDGYGNLVDDLCPTCQGRGTVPKKRQVKIKIPPGVDTGHVVRVKEKGNYGDRNSGQNGNLYLMVTVEKHPQFWREESDVHTNLVLSVAQAILGDIVTIPTLEGSQKITVKPGTQHGSSLCLTGAGISTENKKGDFYVHFKIQVPSNLTKEQHDLITVFAAEESPVVAVQPVQIPLMKRLSYLLPIRVKAKV